MGSHKNLIIEYIDTFFPGYTHTFFVELQSMIMDYDSPQAKAFLAWVDRDDSPTMLKDGKVRCTEAEYAAQLTEKPLSSVEFIMKDAATALFDYPSSVNAEYYKAEFLLCLAELKSRE